MTEETAYAMHVALASVINTILRRAREVPPSLVT